MDKATPDVQARFEVYIDGPGLLTDMLTLDLQWRRVLRRYQYQWPQLSPQERGQVDKWKHQQNELADAFWIQHNRPRQLRIDDEHSNCTLVLYTDALPGQQPTKVTQRHFQNQNKMEQDADWGALIAGWAS